MSLIGSKPHSELSGEHFLSDALPEREQTFTEEWATTHAVPITDTLRGWWEEPKKFKIKKDLEYQVAGLIKVYKLVAVMLCRMYGRPDATTFSVSWLPLMHFITIYGTRFNWSNLLIAALKTNISTVLAPEEGYSS